jgi:DNA-binding beta-propeller fold protein YncE
MRRSVLVLSAAAIPALAWSLLPSAPVSADATPTWERIGTYSTGLGEESAEIAALEDDRLYVVNSADNSLDVVDVSDPAIPTLLKRVSLAPYGGGPNSVAVKDGLVAVVVEALDPTQPGRVLFFNPAGKALAQLAVGALPDMVTFTPDGKHIIVANEGEPSSYGQANSVDPVGTVSIVDINSRSFKKSTVRTATFDNFTREQLVASGVRLNGPGATVPQDLEPEYVAVSTDSRTAWVTLQEANAYATIDIHTGTVTDITSFGAKDHDMAGQGIDASDRDGAIAIRPWPVFGLYMPDAIAGFEAGGRRYVVTANEGDARDYTGFKDEVRVKDLATTGIDVDAFGGADAWAALRVDAAIGRLTVSSTDGINTDTGLREELYAFGGRSFSIWDADTGELVHDSGDTLEQVTAAAAPAHFNASNTDNTFDSRSDNKGPEPEGVAVGELGGRTYAFVGLERIGGFMVFDVTDPASPALVEWVNNRDFTDPEFGPDGGPEGLSFVASHLTPTGEPVLVVSNEITGTVSLYGPSIAVE